MNDALVQQSKYKREELLGHTMMEKYPGIEKTGLFLVMNRCMQERVPAHFDNEFTFPDGSMGCFELRINPVPEGISILSMDISERKRAEKERQRQLKGLEDMLHLTSHKVRQPVNSIMGVTSLLEDPGHSPEQVKEMLGYIRQSALSLDAFTRELVVFMHDLKEGKR